MATSHPFHKVHVRWTGCAKNGTCGARARKTNIQTSNCQVAGKYSRFLVLMLSQLPFIQFLVSLASIWLGAIHKLWNVIHVRRDEVRKIDYYICEVACNGEMHGRWCGQIQTFNFRAYLYTHECVLYCMRVWAARSNVETRSIGHCFTRLWWLLLSHMIACLVSWTRVVFFWPVKWFAGTPLKLQAHIFMLTRVDTGNT